MVDSKTNVLVEAGSKKNREKARRIEARKRLTEQGLSILPELQVQTRNRKRTSQVIKSEGVGDDELFGDEYDTLGEVITPRSISTGSHKRINESGLTGLGKKKAKLANKQGLMATHEEDVVRVVKIEFQRNSKIDLLVVFRCGSSTMYLSASSGREGEIIHFWDLVHQHLRDVFIRILDEVFGIKLEPYASLLIGFASAVFPELLSLSQGLRLNQLFVVENKIHLTNYNIYLVNIKQNLDAMIKNQVKTKKEHIVVEGVRLTEIAHDLLVGLVSLKDDSQLANINLTHNVSMLAGICEPIRRNFLAYGNYVSQFSQQIIDDKAVILDVCYIIGRLLGFFFSEAMATNSEKVKEAMEIDDEATNEGQGGHGHLSEAGSEIIHMKCDRCHIGLEDQPKSPKEISFSFLILIDAHSCQCSKCDSEFEAKAIVMATPAAETKVKDEWSKGYWAEYLKVKQSTWEAEMEQQFKEQRLKELKEKQAEKEVEPILDQSQIDRQINEAKQEMRANLATDYNFLKENFNKLMDEAMRKQ